MVEFCMRRDLPNSWAGRDSGKEPNIDGAKKQRN